MAQGNMGEAALYRFSVTFYVSPAGMWTVDLDTSIDWAKSVRTPLLSGTADRSLSFQDEKHVAQVIESQLAAGISRIVMPF